ncbi:MAG: chitobiase/beta-hexosaminidase C-terminal domain-containing protein, partial [Firmicutes bacterium]|nr:chitobiase/beta-hexosaminidase C-terminal domain-containing protein [Bacillota bacterium]
VTASVQGEEILLRAIAPGTTSITVITSHPEHSDASTVFSVTVAQVVTAAPTASTGSGEVAENTAITLNTATAAATIYYTTDGSQPTTGSLRYDAANPPVVPAGGFTLKAMASKDGQTDSAVVTYTYATPAPNEPPPDDPPPEEEPLPEPQDPDEEETAGEDE